MIKKIKNELEAYITEHTFMDFPQSLYEPINYILSTGGKRLRPLICLLLSKNGRNEISEDAYKCAYLIEVFHNFTLMHDDIMDEATLRRGFPAVHLKYDLSSAILSGDAMLILCIHMLSQVSQPEKELFLNEFLNAALDVCKGQELDMEYEKKDIVDYADYIEMVRLKTGVLIGQSMFMGSILGGISVEDAYRMKSAGEQIGIAFQIKDDYLDAYGEVAHTGKKRGGDILNGKKTLLYYYAVSRAEENDRKILNTIFSMQEMKSDNVVEQVLHIYDKYQVPLHIEDEIQSYIDITDSLLDDIHLSEEITAELSKLLPLLTSRRS